jgi:lipopolysaccharide export system protein LptA
MIRMSSAAHVELAPASAARRCKAAGVVAMALLAACPLAHAERADRTKPIAIESDGEPSSVFDLNRRAAVLTGHVSITQGTLEIHAARVEIAEDRAGLKLATAFGAPGSPTHFRQKADRPDEWCEGDASRIEYDGVANRIRFVGDAHLRILHGTTVTESENAATITYDAEAGTVTIGGGRSTMVLAPRSTSDAPPASAPATPQP